MVFDSFYQKKVDECPHNTRRRFFSAIEIFEIEIHAKMFLPAERHL